MKLLCTTLRYVYSPVNLLHIFRIPFLKNTSGGLLPKRCWSSSNVKAIFTRGLLKTKRLLKNSEKKSCLFVSDRELFL